jgi:hypothetical protein
VQSGGKFYIYTILRKTMILRELLQDIELVKIQIRFLINHMKDCVHGKSFAPPKTAVKPTKVIKNGALYKLWF